MTRQRPSDEERRRTPPGQHLVSDFPVLHAGSVPYRATPADWDLRIWGEVERPVTLTWDDFRALPSSRVVCDIHCVTTWSKLDTIWEGVAFSWVVEHCRPTPRATHVIAHAEEGYTANLPLAVLDAPDVLLADRYGNAPLTPDHGAPLRLLVPSRYLWKSAKWLRGLEFTTADAPGFWERLGYSNSADPWREERYAF